MLHPGTISMIGQSWGSGEEGWQSPHPPSSDIHLQSQQHLHFGGEFPPRPQFCYFIHVYDCTAAGAWGEGKPQPCHEELTATSHRMVSHPEGSRKEWAEGFLCHDTEQLVSWMLPLPPAASQGQNAAAQESSESCSIYQNQSYHIKMWHLGPSAF